MKSVLFAITPLRSLDSERTSWYFEFMAPIIEVKDMVKAFPGVKAVDNVSLTIEQGICFGLLWPNGCEYTLSFSWLTNNVKPGQI